MTQALQPLLDFGRPLTSPFLALLVLAALGLPQVRRWCAAHRAALTTGTVLAFWLLHAWLCSSPRVSAWLTATESPMVAVFLVVVLPALYLPAGRIRRVFPAVPAAALVLAVSAVFESYRDVSAGRWAWFLIPPGWLIAGAASLLVLLQPLLSLSRFRAAVRLTCLLVLVFGGTVLRTSYADYVETVNRRPDAKPGVMTLNETVPVMRDPARRTYLPSAPCRFTADGGYVQGCNMELAQRIMQLNWGAAAAGQAAELGEAGVLLGAVVLFLIMSFVLARWFCGWLCPLSTLGGVLDWARRKLRLPHLKPVRPVKLAYLFSGAGLAAVTLAMAKAYPHIDGAGRFAGCKIPAFPFCKICPSQQVCPVASGGPGAYPGLPSWSEWPFFRTMVMVLLAVFALSFVLGRRLWCRLCPMGMISGIFNRGGLMKLRKNALKCNSCGVCAEVCPMDIDLVRSQMVGDDVSTYDCVLCLECVAKCPRDACLALEHAGITVTESRYTGDS